MSSGLNIESDHTVSRYICGLTGEEVESQECSVRLGSSVSTARCGRCGPVASAENNFAEMLACEPWSARVLRFIKTSVTENQRMCSNGKPAYGHPLSCELALPIDRSSMTAAFIKPHEIFVSQHGIRMLPD